MKNKGFTIIEFAVSFCMVAAISITLFQLIISMKDLYLSGNVKTALLNKQGILTKRIYDDMYNYTLKEVSSCGISCLTFSYLNEATNETKTAELSLDPYNVTITYDSYTIKLDNGSYFGKIEVVDTPSIYSTTDLDIKNSLLNIKIPIYNSLVNGDYGIDVTYQYNSSKTVIDNNMNTEDIIITLDNQDIEVIEESGNYYAKIFYHNVAGGNVFTSEEEFIKNNSTTKFSALYALDLFKGKYSSKNIQLYEFMLKYPSLSAANSNRWYQENNFIKKEIAGFEAIDIVWNANWNSVGHFNGINKITEKSSCGYALMTNEENSNGNCYMTLGAKKSINDKLMVRSDTDYSSSDVALYVRVDDYITTYGLSTVK